MPGELLFDRCLQIVRESAIAQNWPLTPQAVQALTRDVCALYPPDATPDPADIGKVVSNYYQDGAAVREMLSRGSRTGEALWDAWCMHFVKLGQAQHLNRQDAEDLSQIVYSQAQKALETFEFRSRLSTYLRAVFARCYCRFWNRLARRAEDPWPDDNYEEDGEGSRAPEIADRGPLTPALAETHDLSRGLWELVREECERAHRSEDYQILRWYYLEETYLDETTGEVRRWTEQAIADRLGMRLNTVTSRRHRLLKRLRANRRLRELLGERLERRAA